MAKLDKLTQDSIAARKAGMSYGQYMASLYKPPVIEVDIPDPEKRYCLHCGQEIPKFAHKNRRYCSDPCHDEARRKMSLANYHEKKAKEDPSHVRRKRVCKICGKEIPKERHGCSRYCSVECKHKKELQVYRYKNAKHSAKVKAMREANSNGEI